jgi:hypothetical protein
MIIRKNESKIKDDKALKSKICPSQAGMKGKGVNNLSGFPDPSPSPRPSPLKGEGVSIKGFIIIKALITKFLLTSLCQREELSLFEKEGRGEILLEMSILF